MIYVLNTDEKVVAVLSNDSRDSCPYWNDKHTEAVEDSLSTYEFEAPAEHPVADFLVAENYIARQGYDPFFLYFKIKNVEEYQQDGQYIKKVFCENAAISELNGFIIRPDTLNGVTAEQAVEYILQGTGWSLGQCDFLGTQDFKFENYETALQALHMVRQQFDGQMYYSVEIDGTNIVSRNVNLVNRRGSDPMVRFEYKQNLRGAKRIEDSSQLATALIALGKADENGNRMTITSVNNGLDYVEDTDARDQWSRDGRHIWGVYINEDATNPTELKNKALAELENRKNPAFTYETDVLLLETVEGYEHQAVRLDDQVVVIDRTFSPPLEITARVIELDRCYTDPTQDKAVLGNYQPAIYDVPAVVEKMRRDLTTKANIAQAKAELAQNTADTAQQTATQAQDVATVAQTVANTAQSTATQAQNTANTAQSTAQQAQTTAQQASDTANQAQTTANNAQTTAQQAQDTANQAQTAANNAQTVATNAQNTANQIKSTVDSWKHPSDQTTIDGGKIYTGSITSYQIAAGTITGANIAAGTITSGNIAANTITAGNIAAGAIDTTKISASGIQADTIKGGTLTLGGVNNIKGRLEVQADDQTPIHFIDSTQASFSNAYAGYFKSPTAAFKNSDDYTIYVDPVGGNDSNDGLTTSTQIKSLTEAFNRLPDYNDGNITILIANNTGTWSESDVISLSGVHGAGTITIDFQTRTNTLNTRIKIIQCTNCITIKNGTVKNNAVFGSNLSEGVIHIQSSIRVVLDNLYLDARSSSKLQYCVAVTFNSYCRVNNCECYNGASAQIVASYGSFADVRNTVGSGGTYGVLAVGAVIVGTGNAPSGGTNLQLLEGGICNVSNPGFSFQPGTLPGAPPTQTYTTTWTATRTASYRTTYGWRSDSDYVYQGQYSNYGNHTGMIFFDDASIRSALAGKTIKSVRLYLSRRAGGTNSAQSINVYTHNHTTSIINGSAPTVTLAKSNAGSYAVGDKKYISLPTSIGDALKNNTAKGIAIYASSGSPYCIFDGVNEGSSVTPKLEITYEG